jgi:hypothetical protein
MRDRPNKMTSARSQRADQPVASGSIGQIGVYTVNLDQPDHAG